MGERIASKLTFVQLFKNERVRVCSMKIEPEGFFEYTHRFPTLRWNVGFAEVVLTTQQTEKETTHMNMRNKEVFWVEKGTTWKIANRGFTPLYQIFFEIQKETPKYSEEHCKLLLERCKYSTEVGTKLLFENELIRAWDFSYEVNGGDEKLLHQHTIDYVFTIVGDFPQRLIGYKEDGSILFDEISKEGDVEFTEINNGGFESDGVTPSQVACHAVRNGSDQYPYIEYLCELK